MDVSIELIKDMAHFSPCGANDEKVLRTCMGMSEKCWIGKVDAQPACIWGLIPPTILSEQAYLWLVVTDLVEGHKFAFIRHSQRMIEKMLEDYPLIVGHVIVGNHRGKKWLKWLGARFGETQDGKTPFKIRRH